MKSGLVLGTIVIVAVCCSDGRSSPVDQSASASSIKTEFIVGATLSSNELQQVVALARQCGIQQVAEVRTFNYLPTIANGISVKSVEKIYGRSHAYDIITIDRHGWGSDGPSKGAIELGDFWTNKSQVRHIVLREYNFNGKTIEIKIGDKVAFSEADQIVAAIFARKIHGDLDFKRIFEFEPSGVYVGERGGYEFIFKKGSFNFRIISLEVRGGEIFVTGVADGVI